MDELLMLSINLSIKSRLTGDVSSILRYGFLYLLFIGNVINLVNPESLTRFVND